VRRYSVQWDIEESLKSPLTPSVYAILEHRDDRPRPSVFARNLSYSEAESQAAELNRRQRESSGPSELVSYDLLFPADDEVQKKREEAT
jgi:hypothetical protein